MLHYIDHTLYRLKNTKIVFKHHQPNNSKLYQSTFNYIKFHAINCFIQYIWDYGNIVNYNIIYSKTVYNYFLKVFYNKTNKKEYNLQI